MAKRVFRKLICMPDPAGLLEFSLQVVIIWNNAFNRSKFFKTKCFFELYLLEFA